MPSLTPVARKLRTNQTDAEQRLWSRLRSRQIEDAKFVRQYPIGNAIADFCCRALRLVVELDGGQHADSAIDEERTRMMEAAGFRVIRFWNNDVLANTEGVLEVIAGEIRLARNCPHPDPLPSGRGS